MKTIKMGIINLAGGLAIISKYGINAKTPKSPPIQAERKRRNLGIFFEYTLHRSNKISASKAKFIKKETSAYTVTASLSFVHIMRLL